MTAYAEAKLARHSINVTQWILYFLFVIIINLINVCNEKLWLWLYIQSAL